MSKDFRDAEVLLDVQNLKQYFGSMRASVKAVEDVSFQIHKGGLHPYEFKIRCFRKRKRKSVFPYPRIR